MEVQKSNTTSRDGIVKLVSMEGESYDVPTGVARMSNLVCIVLDESQQDDEDNDEDGDCEDEVVLPKITNKMLTKIIDYCTHYTSVEPMTTIESLLQSYKLENLVQPWYCNYLHMETPQFICELLIAANYMEINPLLGLTSLAVAIGFGYLDEDHYIGLKMFDLTTMVIGICERETRALFPEEQAREDERIRQEKAHAEHMHFQRLKNEELKQAELLREVRESKIRQQKIRDESEKARTSMSREDDKEASNEQKDDGSEQMKTIMSSTSKTAVGMGASSDQVVRESGSADRENGGEQGCSPDQDNLNTDSIEQDDRQDEASDQNNNGALDDDEFKALLEIAIANSLNEMTGKDDGLSFTNNAD